MHTDTHSHSNSKKWHAWWNLGHPGGPRSFAMTCVQVVITQSALQYLSLSPPFSPSLPPSSPPLGPFFTLFHSLSLWGSLSLSFYLFHSSTPPPTPELRSDQYFFLKRITLRGNAGGNWVKTPPSPTPSHPSHNAPRSGAASKAVTIMTETQTELRALSC